jgi:hypothetical protein
MKLKSIFLIVAFAAIAAAADSPAQVKAALQSQMGLYVGAIKSKDVKKVEAAIRANFAPEFIDFDVKGRKRTLEETINMMKMNVSTLKSVKAIKLDVASVKLSGDKASTVENFLLDAVVMEPGDSKKSHTLKVQTSWAGTYVKRNGKWMCTSSKAIKEVVHFDGKKMQ